MRLLTTIFLLSTILSYAQEGFINSYDFSDNQGLSFHHILLVEDTLIIGGEISHPDFPQWGVFFAKMDTIGNIIEYKTHFDSSGYSYVFNDGATMIKTSDGGYAMIGANLNLSSLMLFKLDVNGNKEFFNSYPDTTTFLDSHFDITETDYGYLYVGSKQQMDDYRNDAFAMRLDKQGNVIWEISYGEVTISDNFVRVTKINDNEFNIYGSSGFPTPVINPDENAWFKDYVLTIDSLGNILNLWETDEYLITEGLSNSLFDIQFDGEGNSVSLSAVKEVKIIFGEPSIVAQPALIGRDQDYNVLWHTPFKDASNSPSRNRFNDLAQTSDNGWVAVGSYSNILNYNTYEGFRTGLIAKINANGDSLWSRIDTVFTPANTARPKLESVVVLPSGSIIACGQLDRLVPTPSKSFGWLIKIDKYGCIESGCNPATSLNMVPSVNTFEVFPNPTEDVLNIKGQGNFDIVIYDVKGNESLSFRDFREEIQISLDKLDSGLYFVQIRQGNAFLTKKIMKK